VTGRFFCEPMTVLTGRGRKICRDQPPNQTYHN
jgi:hypothetical protein